jgi:hypothetical protein
MKLISSSEACEITGLTTGALCRKHLAGKFPNPIPKKRKKDGRTFTFYDEKKVLKWKAVLESEIARLHRQGVSDGAIAYTLSTSKDRVVELIFRMKSKKASMDESFHLVLKISANIRSKLL